MDTKQVESPFTEWRILHQFLLKGGESPLQLLKQSIMDLFEFPFQVNEVHYVAIRILHHL